LFTVVVCLVTKGGKNFQWYLPRAAGGKEVGHEGCTGKAKEVVLTKKKAKGVPRGNEVYQERIMELTNA